jgi:DNA-binding NarL/FixJ family response regulator
MVRLLIADDHEVVRSGLRSILEDRKGWSVVAEAADGKQAIAKTISEKPDIAILDYSLPLINGLEVAREVRAQLPKIEVLMFTMYESDTLLRDLLRAGVRGYLLKSDAIRYLYAAVEALSAHKPFITNKVSDTLLDTFLKARPKDDVLTHRERSIVQLVAEGHSNKVIATVLDIGVKTVETHRAAIMRKLGLTSSAALVRYAVRNRLVEP